MITKELLMSCLLCLSLIACTNSNIYKTNSSVHLTPALGDAPLSNQFNVKVNGINAAVEKMSKIDIPIHYTQLAYDESAPMTVEITVDNPIKFYSISPLRKGIQGEVKENTLSFTVTDAYYLIVKINNMEDLFLLINPLVDYEAMVKGKKVVSIMSYGVDSMGVTVETVKIQRAIDEVSAQKGVLYFPKGKYRTGELYMRSDMSVWLAEQAIICGSVDLVDYKEKSLIRMDSVSNFKLLGNGTIDGSGWAGLRKNGAKEFHLVYASNCDNVLYDGVVLRDPTFWNTRVYRSRNFHMKNIKVLNNRPFKNWTNTDGVDFDSSMDCSLVNSVIHAGDDNIVVKGLDNERKHTSERILFDRILTLSNSAATKIGTETCVEYFKDITFKNIDVVKCKRGLVINGFDSTRITNVRFENITIENFDFNGDEYPRLIDFEITNKSWRECAGHCVIEDVAVSKLNVMCSMNRVESQILGNSEQYSIKNVKIDNSKAAGKSIVSGSDIGLITNEFVKRISFAK